ncbi:hypothetical protein BDV36DRAFT_272879 [Aspergillus pseudocaelatus]|uniref:Solute carrier family 40 member n=1 Tax=Aspergillus pseudocaelatus TaxID=1825620 RepID=A0ABQ6W4B0_9EURO|nr:hypothetical protein BDV36DRAFT_272879 [Aspergillus pseudocaelatus]
MLTVPSITKRSTSPISNISLQKETQKDKEPVYVVKLFTVFLCISKMTARAAQSSTPPEYSPLLSDDPEAAGHAHSTFPQNQHERHVANAPPSKLARHLYLSHFLSTWNSRVFEFGAELQQPKTKASFDESSTESDQQNSVTRLWNYCHRITHKAVGDFASCFRHPVFLPSFSGALLYLTVLSFAGQMVTWLLSTGYDSTQVGIARTLAVAFEVLAIWIAPWLMGRIGPTCAGLWLANWQIASLVAGISIFWIFPDLPPISVSGLVGGTILSRVGLRGFDLCVQILVQGGVEAENRGNFSSIEAAWQNAFEIGSYISTIVFPRPDQFRWPALISITAVGIAGILYTVFARMKRGHLIHVPKWIAAPGMLQQTRERCLERISSASDF